MKVKVPFLTSNEDEVMVVEILVNNHEKVKKNQKIFTLETTKTSFEAVSEYSGFILFNFKKNEFIKCGDIMYEIFENQKILKEAENKSEIKIENKIITDDAKKIIDEKKIDLNLIKEKIVNKEILNKYLVKKKEIKIPKGNNKSVVIVGASNHGKTVYDFLIDNGKYDPICFINYNSNFLSDELIFNLSVFELDYLADIYNNGTKNIYINTNDFNLTKKIYSDAKKIGYNFINVIHKTASVSKISKMGECVFVGPFSIIGTGARVGSFTKILNKASVAHDSIIGDNVQISDGATIGGNAFIGNDTLVGINSAVINKCKIGKGVIVVSGKTVTSNLDDKIIYKK